MRSIPLLVAVFLAAVAPSPARAAERWRWPVRGEVVQRFALGADPYTRGQHRGVDVAAPVGSVVRAACAGRVRFAGRAGSFGRAVTTRCGAFVVSYGHLAAVHARRGDRVRAGEPIGRVGATGSPSSPGSHLHLGVRRATQRHGYVDPLRLLGDREPAPPPLAPAAKRRPPAPKPAPAPRPHPNPLPRTRALASPAPRRLPQANPLPRTRALAAPAPAPPARASLPLATYLGAALLLVAVPGLALLEGRARGRRRRTHGPATAGPRQLRFTTHPYSLPSVNAERSPRCR